MHIASRKFKFIQTGGFALVGALLVIICRSSVAAAIAHGYLTSDTGLQTGMVAALSTDSSDASRVERATQDNSQRVVGVATTLDKSLVTIASSNAMAIVEDEGEVEAYVTDLNGTIKKGDLLAISPLKGILMKSAGKQAEIIAIAGADFSSVPTEPYTGSAEADIKSAQIAKIKINLNRQGITSGSTVTDSALAHIGRAIAGKDVSEARVIIALVIFLLVLIAEGGIVYGAVSSSIIALGRNPLASKIIHHELIPVIITALLVMMVGLAAIYGVLWI